MLSFCPRGVLDEILNLIESVSEDFPSYSYMYNFFRDRGMDLKKIKKRERNATFVLLAGGWEMNERQMERLVG